MFKHYCGDGVEHKNIQDCTIKLWHELLDAFGLLQLDDLSNLDGLHDDGKQKDNNSDNGNDNDTSDNKDDKDLGESVGR